MQDLTANRPELSNKDIHPGITQFVDRHKSIFNSYFDESVAAEHTAQPLDHR